MKLKNKLDELKLQYSDDKHTPYIQALENALNAFKAGNYGVGAVIIDTESKEIICNGQNRIFTPTFNSSLHAEMDAINNYESIYEDKESSNLELITTLEPCPMCTSRIISSKLTNITFMSDDPEGGMASRLVDMPPVWQEIAKDTHFQKSAIPNELVSFASEVFESSRDYLDKKLME